MKEDNSNHWNKMSSEMQKQFQTLMDLNIRALQNLNFLKPEDITSMQHPKDIISKHLSLIMDNNQKFLDYTHKSFQILESTFLPLFKSVKSSAGQATHKQQSSTGIKKAASSTKSRSVKKSASKSMSTKPAAKKATSKTSASKAKMTASKKLSTAAKKMSPTSKPASKTAAKSKSALKVAANKTSSKPKARAAMRMTSSPVKKSEMMERNLPILQRPLGAHSIQGNNEKGKH